MDTRAGHVRTPSLCQVCSRRRNRDSEPTQTSRLRLNERVRASGMLPGVVRHIAARRIMERRRMLALCAGAEVGCRTAHLLVHEYLVLAVFTNEPYQDDADLVENH
jgi:hypothetical protein